MGQTPRCELPPAEQVVEVELTIQKQREKVSETCDFKKKKNSHCQTRFFFLSLYTSIPVDASFLPWVCSLSPEKPCSCNPISLALWMEGSPCESIKEASQCLSLCNLTNPVGLITRGEQRSIHLITKRCDKNVVTWGCSGKLSANWNSLKEEGETMGGREWGEGRVRDGWVRLPENSTLQQHNEAIIPLFLCVCVYFVFVCEDSSLFICSGN